MPCLRLSLCRRIVLVSLANIEILKEGVCVGNVIFLPKGASIIDISPVNHEDKPAWIFFMAADYKALHFNPIRVPEQKAVPMLNQLKAYKQWHLLTTEWR